MGVHKGLRQKKQSQPQKISRLHKLQQTRRLNLVLHQHLLLFTLHTLITAYTLLLLFTLPEVYLHLVYPVISRYGVVMFSGLLQRTPHNDVFFPVV